MSEESNTPPSTTDKSFYQKLIGFKIKFKGICLKQDTASFRNKKLVNLYV